VRPGRYLFMPPLRGVAAASAFGLISSGVGFRPEEIGDTVDAGASGTSETSVRPAGSLSLPLHPVNADMVT
ncbi:hypothetical protein Q604_UNBC07047G0001, partial [human gut metagenome]